jgi:hypothetical protein
MRNRKSAMWSSGGALRDPALVGNLILIQRLGEDPGTGATPTRAKDGWGASPCAVISPKWALTTTDRIGY